MQVFEQGAAANDTQYLPARHRTLPIPESVTPIAKYPTKPKIFKALASRYWQVRCYLRGKTYTQSLKTTNKSAAISQAKQFIHARHHGHIHAAVLGPPFVKRRRADAQLTTHIGNADARLNAFNRVHDLTIA